MEGWGWGKKESSSSVGIDLVSVSARLDSPEIGGAGVVSFSFRFPPGELGVSARLIRSIRPFLSSAATFLAKASL